MGKQTLKDKAAKGLLWGGLSNTVQQMLNLFFGIFLARLLTPADYGMVGMLSIFSLIAGSIQESGFVAALTNKKKALHEDYNAVFWFSVITGLVLYGILFACAPLIAEFFHQPELVSLSRYCFLGFVLASTGTAHTAYMFRHIMVKQKTISSLIGLVVSGCVGVFMAYKGFSYWGIATQSITYIATTMLCYWYFSPWRPTFCIDLRPLRGMVRFSFKLLLTNVFNHVNNNVFSVILGKFYTASHTGFYNQANKWNLMGYSMVNGMISGIAQPVMAQVADDRERLLRVFRKMLRFTAFISFPAMFGLSLIAPEVILISITDKWSDSVYMLQVLCISGAFVPIVTLYSNLAISKGKSDIYMWNVIVLGLLQLMAMSLLYPYGIDTMIYVYVSINVSWLFVWHFFIRRFIPFGYLKMLRDVFPLMLVAAATMIVTYYVTRPIENDYVRVVCKILMAASLYSLVMWLTGSAMFKESLNYILKKTA